MTNVVIFPPQPPTHKTVQLVNLNGHVFASAGFPTNIRDPGAPWDWIRETVAHELSVHEDQIGCEEGENLQDFVTVDGLRVYRVEIVRPKSN